jgi:hypothetical protein
MYGGDFIFLTYTSQRRGRRIECRKLHSEPDWPRSEYGTKLSTTRSPQETLHQGWPNLLNTVSTYNNSQKFRSYEKMWIGWQRCLQLCFLHSRFFYT